MYLEYVTQEHPDLGTYFDDFYWLLQKKQASMDNVLSSNTYWTLVQNSYSTFGCVKINLDIPSILYLFLEAWRFKIFMGLTIALSCVYQKIFLLL